jgi:leader peptidase (prepilin peptidase)/N-methyltransferase
VIGSFLNVCIYRLPLGESLLSPPSHCPKCQTRLRPADLFPLLSYTVLLRGKCRYCKAPISPRYFIIEFITGALFLAFWCSFAHLYQELLPSHSGMLLLAMAWIWASAMLVTFMIDLDTTYVIEPVTWVGMAAGIIFELTRRHIAQQPLFSVAHIAGVPLPYLDAIPGMIIGFGAFLLIDQFGRLLFRKPGMGLGDSYIGAAIGALLGPGLALLSFGIAIFAGAIVGIIIIVLEKISPTPAPRHADSTSEGALREILDDELPPGRYMPFGPFLTTSAVLLALLPDWVLLQTQHLWHWYLHLF